MKIKVTAPFSGPYGAPIPGQTVEVPDEYGESIVAAGKAEPVEKKTSKRTKKKATETPEAKADDVETADDA